MVDKNQKVLARLIKRSRLSEAALIVLGLWIIMLGADLVILARLNILSAPVFWSAFILVSLGVFGGWLALAGAGYLLGLAAGGKGEYRDVLVGLAFSAWPLAVLGVFVIFFNFLAALLDGGTAGIVGTSLLLIWLGLIIGVPGYGLALVLEVALKVVARRAIWISVGLLVFTGVILIWQYGQLVDFGYLLAAHVCHGAGIG